MSPAWTVYEPPLAWLALFAAGAGVSAAAGAGLSAGAGVWLTGAGVGAGVSAGADVVLAVVAAGAGVAFAEPEPGTLMLWPGYKK